MARALIVIARHRFREEELFEATRALEGAGHGVIVASALRGTCYGTRSKHVEASLSIVEAQNESFDALVYVGGPGARGYFTDPSALALARNACSNGKLVGAICIAPVILANAGIVRGRRIATFASTIAACKGRGALVQGPGVVIDGNIVTASGPDHARAFGASIVDLLQTMAAHRTLELSA